MLKLSAKQAARLLGVNSAAKHAPQAAKSRVLASNGGSLGECTLALQLRANGVKFTPEFKFAPSRRWRADFRLDGTNILIEVEGGTWSGGRHTRGGGFAADCEKYTAAALLGFRVLRYTTEQVKAGKAIDGALQALASEGLGALDHGL